MHIWQTCPLVVLDAAGNTLSDRNGKRTFEYNNAGRLARFFKAGIQRGTYTYNAQGQRTRKVKVNNKGKIKTFVYHYDLQGNLLAETREDGSVRKVYVWADARPIAQIKHKRNTGVDTPVYLHTDHLNTPRLGTDATGTVIWTWESRAFGNTKPDPDPDDDASPTRINLRLPGQYRDGESGLYYNWHRYYDPGKGRYITSDPIGLNGGLNFFAYVVNNPLRFSDALGLVITGEFVSLTPTVSDIDFLGLTADLKRFPDGRPVDRIGYANFTASGTLRALIKCMDTECDETKVWFLNPSVRVADARFRIPITEPALPIPGMGYVILLDRILRLGEHVAKAREEIKLIGKALLGSPTAICRNTLPPLTAI